MNKITFELKGLKEFQRNLDKITKELDSLKEQTSTFEELFSPAFMTKYTQFKTIEDMVEKSPIKGEKKEDFISEKWNKFVKEETSFQSWAEMLAKAGEEYFGKKVNQVFKKVCR
jgi:hypothetical protein